MKSSYGQKACFCAIALLLVAAVSISMAAYTPKYHSSSAGSSEDQSGSSAPENAQYDLSGKWKMVANIDYNFDLDIKQRADQITGTMTRTNGDEPVDKISGTVSSDGKVQFTRVRPDQWTQIYTGTISGSQGSLSLTGTLTQSGSAPVSWNATQATSLVSSSLTGHNFGPAETSFMASMAGLMDKEAPKTTAIGKPASKESTIDATAAQTTTTDRYEVYQFSLTMPSNYGVAAIDCYSGGTEIAAILFLKDDAPILQNWITQSGYWVVYYPYSRYNDILDMFKKGNVVFRRDPTTLTTAQFYREGTS
jgi:hypothetical protein